MPDTATSAAVKHKIAMTAPEFRKALLKIMPGFRWTVHKSENPRVLRATGIMSSGSNRLATLQVIREDSEHIGVTFIARMAGNGTRAIFGPAFRNSTIASALWDLQNHHDRSAATHRVMVSRLQKGRCAPEVRNA
jgi:hypothetical protein